MTKDSWQECKVGELARDERNSFVIGPFGSDLVQADYRESGVPVVFVRDIKRSRFHWISDVYVSDQKAEALKAHSAREGDLVITKMGLPPGIAAVYPESSPAGVITADIIRLRPDSKKVHSSFLCELLNSHDIRKQVYERTAGQTRPKLTLADYKTIRLSLPPLPEQKKIAQILSTWDKAITTTEQRLANSQQQKKALMQQLLTGKQRLLDQNGERFEGEWTVSKTPYKQLPSDWSEVGLSDISSFITKGATPTTYGYEWQDSGIPFIRSECVGESGFKESGLAFIGDDAHKTMSRSKVFSGDILITITGNVGRVCKLPDSIPEANINQHIAKITLDKNVVCPDFVFHCLQDRKYRVHFERITTGQAYPQISLVQVRDAVIPMPTVYEQQQIAAVLSAADQEITTLQQQLDHLKQEKKALMQQLLTGKRRVKVEPA